MKEEIQVRKMARRNEGLSELSDFLKETFNDLPEAMIEFEKQKEIMGKER